jgi:hypothetical protein
MADEQSLAQDVGDFQVCRCHKIITVDCNIVFVDSPLLQTISLSSLTATIE